MSEWRISVEADPLYRRTSIRIGRFVGGYIEAIVGDEIRTIDEGEVLPVFATLPYDAVEALAKALTGYLPPTSDADLRDALEVERRRVDHVLESALELMSNE